MVDADCAATPIPDTNPTGCAEAHCKAGVCAWRARDKDGDGDPAKFCKDLTDSVVIELGKDCDDNDSTRSSKAWDGPAGEGHESACDGVDNDCTGTADDRFLGDGTSCECKPGTITQCSEDSGGQPITWPAGEPKGACKYGSRKCEVDVNTGAGVLGPCTDAVAPVAETCDGVDNDCDGDIDEADAVDRTTWAYDNDGDGHGATGIPTVQSCTQPPAPAECAALGIPCVSTGWKPTDTLIAVGDDCDDANAGRNPGLKEVCDSQKTDEDCSGEANPPWLCDCEEGDTRPCFEDSAGKPIPQDPFDPTKALGACKPGTQVCTKDSGTGIGSWSLCFNAVGPKAEVCSNLGVDNDCDGDANDADDIKQWGYDSDNDGHAAAQIAVVASCTKPASPPAECAALGLPCTADAWKLVVALASTGDCDDANALRNPTAKELCDKGKVDENCDGVANPTTLCLCSEDDKEACWIDPNGKTIPQDPADNTKSLGICSPGQHTCVLDPLTGLGSWGACVNGKGPEDETCANLGVDNDCDGDTTDANDKVPLFCDEDDDGQADQFKETVLGCLNALPPASQCGSLPTAKWKPNLNKSDCNDKNPQIKSGIPESCSTVGVDDNCNGTKDENCSCTPGQTRPCFVGPGNVPIPQNPNDPTKSLGVCQPGVQSCDAAGQWEAACNNGVAPTTETCNDPGVDNDCDGDANDEPAAAPLWYCDNDNDGQVTPTAQGVSSCAPPTAPCGGTWLQSPAKLDCDDNNIKVYTGAPELCDGIDNDCDSPTEIDEGAINAITYYCDYDKDGYVRYDAPTRKACPNTALPADNCTSALGNGVWISSPKAGDDCNPTNAKVNPGYWDGPGKGVWGIKSPGLTAYYFTNYNPPFPALPPSGSGLKDTRVWESIDMDMGWFTTPFLATAAGGPYVDSFATRWEGTIIAPKDPANADLSAKTYTFSIASDEGVRLRVNNQLIIDKWIAQGTTTYTGSISLTPGQEVPFVLEWFEYGLTGNITVRWAGALLGDGVTPQVLRLQSDAAQSFVADGCDGIDNDCDGIVDNKVTQSASSANYRCLQPSGLPVGAACQPGRVDPCGSTDVGYCRKGVALCGGNGTYGACVGELVGQANEICDGSSTDYNCNGYPGTPTSPDCQCVNGNVQACFPGNACNTHLTQTCVNGAWTTCPTSPAYYAYNCCKDADADGACLSGAANCAMKCQAGTPNVPESEQCRLDSVKGGNQDWRVKTECDKVGTDCNDNSTAESPLNPTEYNSLLPINAKSPLCNGVNEDCANPSTSGVDTAQVCQGLLSTGNSVSIPISTLLHGDNDFGTSSAVQLGVRISYDTPTFSVATATIQIIAKETGGDNTVGYGTGTVTLPASGPISILSPNLTGSLSCGFSSCTAYSNYYQFASLAPGDTTSNWSITTETVSGVFNGVVGFDIACTGVRSGGADVCSGADCMVCTVSKSTALNSEGMVRVTYF